MKKLNTAVIVVSILTASSSAVFAADAYPFIGKRFFSFIMGNGAETSITIKANGDTVLKTCGDLGAGGSCQVDYKGKFKNPILLKDGTGYLIKGNKIYELDHGKIEKDCGDDSNKECVSDLSK